MCMCKPFYLTYCCVTLTLRQPCALMVIFLALFSLPMLCTCLGVQSSMFVFFSISLFHFTASRELPNYFFYNLFKVNIFKYIFQKPMSFHDTLRNNILSISQGAINFLCKYSQNVFIFIVFIFNSTTQNLRDDVVPCPYPPKRRPLLH